MQNIDDIVTKTRRSLIVQSITGCQSDTEYEITVSRIKKKKSQNKHGPIAHSLFCKTVSLNFFISVLMLIIYLILLIFLYGDRYQIVFDAHKIQFSCMLMRYKQSYHSAVEKTLNHQRKVSREKNLT